MNSMTKRDGIAVHMVGPIESLKINNEKNNRVIGELKGRPSTLNKHLIKQKT